MTARIREQACSDPDRARYTSTPCPCPAHKKWDGHFPGCKTHGCAMTACADARLMAAHTGWEPGE